MDIKDLVLSSLHELELGVEEEAKKDKDKIESEKKLENEKAENRKIKSDEKKENRDSKDSCKKNSNKIEIEEDIKITKDGKTVELKEKITENDRGELEVELENVNNSLNSLNDEKEFLLSLRERLLVLFEGLKSSNNKKVEAKVDLILNFFEYLLATIEDKLEKNK